MDGSINGSEIIWIVAGLLFAIDGLFGFSVSALRVMWRRSTLHGRWFGGAIVEDALCTMSA